MISIPYDFVDLVTLSTGPMNVKVPVSINDISGGFFTLALLRKIIDVLENLQTLLLPLTNL